MKYADKNFAVYCYYKILTRINTSGEIIDFALLLIDWVQCSMVASCMFV